MRHSPPFDGKPCPMCPLEARELSAVTHNLLGAVERNEWDRAGRKIHGFITSLEGLREFIFDHTDLIALRDQAVVIVDKVKAGATWVELHGDFSDLRKLYNPVGKLSEKHFDDPSHSYGSSRSYTRA